MKKYMQKILFTGSLLAISPFLHAMDDNMQNKSNMMKSDMMMNMKQMMEVTEEDLLSNLNDQDKALYKELNPQQKALMLKAANQACKVRMQKMQQMMMQQMNQQEK